MNEGPELRQLATIYPISEIIARHSALITALKKPRGSSNPLPSLWLRGFASFNSEISR